MKIFLDANVIFSACGLGSNVYKFVEFISKKHQLITCEYAIAEVTKNLKVKKPDWEKNFGQVIKLINIYPTHNKDFGVKLPDKDRPILAGAVFYKCEYLVTGDKKDFGHLFGKEIRGVKILPPHKLMEELL